jgi:mannose-6-phosphate isomerase-like protein (cupin superfamily)
MNDVGGDPPCWAHLLENDTHDQSACSARPVIADLDELTVRGSGAVWSLPHGGDLDANLVRLEPDGRISDHVNEEVDVLVLVRSGTGYVCLGGTRVDLASDHLVLIPKAARRSITAGPAGITYLSVHRRRRPLGISGSMKADR